MPQKHAVGIDLGTSTSEICVFRPEGCQAIGDSASPAGSPIVPSLVALNNDGELVVGEAARPWVDLPGRGVREVKRLMGSGQTVRLGDKDYRPEEIAAVILRQLKQQAEAALGEPIRDVVLSVPANFPDAARRATFDAGQLAGLNITRLINEPTAAALAFGVENVDADEQVVVFDFGGGTLDITVLEMVFGVLDVKCSFGDSQLGGKDFDEVLRHLIAQKFRIQHPEITIDPIAAGLLKSAAETVKLALTTKESHGIHLRGFVFHDEQPIDLEVEITRAELEAACQPLLDRARKCIQQALDAKKVRPEVIDRIVLVGGTTYMPCVRRLVEEMLGQKPQADVSPDLAVCIGAAVQAAIALGQLDPERGVILTDVAPFGMGIQVVSEVGGILTPVYEPLIVPNTTVPYSTRREYSLLTTEQEAVIVHLYQDHQGSALRTDDAVDTGIRARIANIPPSQSGRPHTIVIHFSYDVDGLAKLAAVIPLTGQAVRLEYTPSQKRLDAEGKDLSQQRVDDLWQRSSATKRYEGIIARAERLLAECAASPSDEAGDAPARLRRLVGELKILMAGGESGTADASAIDASAIEQAVFRLIGVMMEIERRG